MRDLCFIAFQMFRFGFESILKVYSFGVKVEKLWFFGVLDFEYSRLWALGLLLFAFENLPDI